MPKLNPFSLFLVVIKFLTFSCSPIHRERLKLRFKLDEDSREQSRNSISIMSENNLLNIADNNEKNLELFRSGLKNIVYDDDFSYILWAISHPIETSKLMKKYHMAGNVFIAVFLIHIILVTHLTVKSVIYTFFVNSNEALYQYLANHYYPHTAGVFKEPELFNNLILILSLLSLCVRLHSAFNLIRRSIINRETYKELTMSQINFSQLTIYELTLYDWIEFFFFVRQHDRDIENDSEFERAHFEFSNLFGETESDSLTQKESLYHYNLFDWSECYSDLIVFDAKERREKYLNWHCPLPGPRVSISQLRSMVIVSLLAEAGSVLALVSSLLGCVYLELRSTLPPDYETAKTVELLFRWGEHLLKPYHLIRMFELFLVISLQLPLHYDSGLVLLDATTLMSRITKLNKIFQYDLDDSEEKELKKKQTNFQPKIEYTPFNYILVDYKPDQKYDNQLSTGNDFYTQIEDLNSKLQYNVKLTKLLYLEFVDMKRVHNFHLNCLIIVLGMTMSYTISMSFKIKSTAELIILLTVIVSCLATIMNTLLVCAMIERKFKKLYITMTRLMVNKRHLLTLKTVEQVRLGSEQFQNKKHRSILIGGLYAITLDSIGPVSSLAKFYLNAIEDPHIALT